MVRCPLSVVASLILERTGPSENKERLCYASFPTFPIPYLNKSVLLWKKGSTTAAIGFGNNIESPLKRRVKVFSHHDNVPNDQVASFLAQPIDRILSQNPVANESPSNRFLKGECCKSTAEQRSETPTISTLRLNHVLFPKESPSV